MAIRQHEIVFIGSSGVGKTALITRIDGKPFEENRLLTIAGGCITVPVRHDDDDDHRLLIWDTAGQEKCRTIIPLDFKNAVLIVIVYDITNRESFELVGEWLAMSQAHAPSGIRIALVANKHDREGNRVVTTRDGQMQSNKLEAMVFRETSALAGQGVEELLEEITAAALATPDMKEHDNASQMQDESLAQDDGVKQGDFCC
jgi:small GTP-binding protein